MLNFQPVVCTKRPPTRATDVLQISVRHRLVAEYGVQAVNHWRPLNVW